MRCTICDRCKEIIEDPKQVRIITCSKPIKPRPEPDPRGNHNPLDKQMNDIRWEKELCVKCVDALEAFLDGGAEADAPQSEPETEDPSVDESNTAEEGGAQETENAE